MHKSGEFPEPADITKQETGPFLAEFPLSSFPTLPLPASSPPKQRRIVQESIIVGFFLAMVFLIRSYAAMHTGLEVDEPIYRDAAISVLQHGYPAIRPAYQHPYIPFLYHPPFYFYMLAGWFYLWGSTSYFTGRMYSVITSVIVLLQLYLFTRRVFGWKRALLVLGLVGSDVWVIFTNQAIYIENSLLLLVIPAIWAYWCATSSSTSSRARNLGWYILAGLFAGCAIIYKHIGGFLVIVFVLHLCLRRKHLLGHAVLGGMIALVVECYVLAMHLVFGSLYDHATLHQVYRTVGLKAAPGLNADLLTMLHVIWNRYWIFFITIIVLVGGSILCLVRYVQGVFRLRKIAQPVIVCWALGGVFFAAVISLKNPHYTILWIIPLYVLLAQEIADVFWISPLQVSGFRLSQYIQIRVLGVIVCVLVLVGNNFTYQGRFVNLPPDPLLGVASYTNETVPSTGLVLTKNYIGVDLQPPFLDIDLITTPKQIFQRKISYMVLYWSESEPLPSSLGPVWRYCVPMKEFIGFKDQIEVCKIDSVVLQTLVKT